MSATITQDSVEAATLIDRHHKRLVGWFRARIGDYSEADDLTQRTWIKVLARIHTFDEEVGSFWTFTLIWARFTLRGYWVELRKRPDLVASELTDASASDEDAPPDLLFELYLEGLRRILSARRLPHEVLAFGFSKLLGWKPAEFVSALSPALLREAALRLREEYLRHVPVEDVARAFDEFLVGLERKFDDCDADERTLSRIGPLRQRVCASVRFEEIFGVLARDKPETLVFRWWDAVKRVAMTDLLRDPSGAFAEWLGGGR